MMSFKSFSGKIAFSYLIIFILASFSGTLFTSHSLKNEKIADLKDSLLTQSRLMAPAILAGLAAESERFHIHKKVRAFGEATGARITVIEPGGLVLGDSEQTWEGLLRMDNHAGRPEVQSALAGEPGANIRYSTTMKMEMLYVAVPLKDEQRFLGVLRLALPLGTVEEAIASIQKPVFLGMAFGMLAVIFLGVLLGGSIARRVQRLRDGAKAIMAGNLSRRVDADSADELGVLADTMNQMAAALNDRISEIEEEKNKLSAVLQHMAEAVIAVDCDRRVLIVNPAAEAIFSIHRGEALGKSLIEVVRSPEIADMAERAIRDLSFVSAEVSLVHPVTRELKVSAVGTSCQPGMVCALLVASDISEMRRLENLRKDFVANVSHELKTPLTSIRASIEILQGGGGAEEKSRLSFLRVMEEDSLRLNRLIDDLLELSKMDSGQIALKLETLDLSEEIESAAGLLQNVIHDRDIRFENALAGGQPVTVKADRDRLSQVLINLIENAVKFNRPGGEVRVSAEKQGSLVRVSVRDSGCGIPEKAIPRIFERFYRVDKARSRQLGGTGLGLSIVKNMIEAHGGSVVCESRPGEGSTFSFTLPAA